MGTSTIKRNRRTRAEISSIEDGLLQILQDDHPQTVRGVFYQATVRGLAPKTEAGYRTVQRMLAYLRKDGQLPWDYIADNTRWMRKPTTYDDINEILNLASSSYRKAIWNDQGVNVEVWVEKDALAGVIMEATEKWDVPLMVTRGFSSLSFLYSAAESIKYSRKPSWIYCLTDYDPSGVDISRNIERRLREYAPGAEIHFDRLAVTPEQISSWDLPTRPTKTTDTRSKRFNGDSVELDAIPAWRLRELVNDAIERHIDQTALEATKND